MPTDKNEMRKQMFAEIEEKLFKDSKPEDSTNILHCVSYIIYQLNLIFFGSIANLPYLCRR